MREFAAGKLDVLVATTVIEVGVDVAQRDDDGRARPPTGSASRSCTSLRGRVGRGSAPGLCLLVTEAPPEAPARSGWRRWRPHWTDSGWPSST
jgi:ATP-dependent DNA helicase RecG